MEALPIVDRCLALINASVGNQIHIDFNKFNVRKKTIQGYIRNALDHGFINRIKRDVYEVIKPVDSTVYLSRSVNDLKRITDEAAQKEIEMTKFKDAQDYHTFTRAEMRKEINKSVGSIIDSSIFKKSRRKGMVYLQNLHESGHIQRVGRGKYKVLKKHILKKRGIKPSNIKFKDVSMIPTILNSSPDGLLMDQIDSIYKKITPEDKQVNRNYLYRLIAFGIKEGVILHKPPTIEDVMNHAKGPMPKRTALTNPNINEEEWEEFVNKYRMFYQYKKEHKLGRRRPKPKTVKEQLSKSKPIINSFDEDRNNPNKQFIEEYFIDIVKKYFKKKKIRCFTVTGPDYYRHVNKLFDTIANEVIVCELESDVFNIIYNKAQVCPYYLNNKVSLLNCNIDNIAPSNCYYIDLDLMASITTVYDSIIKQIKNQSYACGDTLKFITFTYSTRSDGGSKKRLRLLKKLLYEGFKTKVESFEGGDDFGTGVEMFNPSQDLKYCLKHSPHIIDYGRIVDIDIFTYSDDYPMMSLLITYK
jgi:hypothetical protein